ncbi:MAG: ACP S-malonyltransferase [Chloroflexi bacterium]|nr:ACP S-malonyltransferase [Chloroflexota bacterium]
MINWQTTALVFPGQGSQAVGMGAEIAAQYPVAREVFAQADALLGLPFSKLCFEGPAEQLDETYNTQPALFITGIAILAALNAELAARGQSPATPANVAGHSLGELTALVAAGAMEFGPGLKLVRERGRLMREAGEKSPGAMAAILGLDIDALRQLCAEACTATGGVLVVANDNCPGQTVISGDDQTLEYALPLAKERGAKRALKLAVSIAAHSPLMAVSQEEFRTAVKNTSITVPKTPVIGNVSAAPLTTAAMIQDELSAQLTSPVRWTESVQAMTRAGITHFIELGPKAVLAGLVKRINKEASAACVENPAQLAALLDS